MQILAHRGDSRKAHENTLSAFQSAYETGADGFEFDIRLSSDGIPVVHHNLMVGDGFIERFDF
ncbi:MAG: glycerophosphodiester phosphodiesterase [Chloroflexota bacterium]